MALCNDTHKRDMIFQKKKENKKQQPVFGCCNLSKSTEIEYSSLLIELLFY